MKLYTENECRSIFQNQRSEPNRENFTRIWIKLICDMERGKAAVQK